MSQIAPSLWLNGRKITGTAKDRAPVLAPVVLTWGSDSPLEQPKPANLKFEVLFLDGMHDVPDLKNGAKVELVHSDGRTIFAGSIRTMTAVPHEHIRNALVVNANATDYTADGESEYISSDYSAGYRRRAELIESFKEEGWTLSVPNDPRPSAAAVYNSIKLFTLLDRHISRYRGRRYDTSYRRENGQVVKRVSVMKVSGRKILGDTLIVNNDGTWYRTYNRPLIDGVISPMAILPASNLHLNPEWTQDPDNTITGVQLQTMEQGEDGLTSLRERNYKASSDLVNEYGLRSVEVETDILRAEDYRAVANEWMNDDSPWQMSDLSIVDSEKLDALTLRELLDQSTRYSELLTVTDILSNRPDPGTSTMRSYLLGGTYTWTGKKWLFDLSLERTIYARPTRLTTFEDIRAAGNQGVSSATLADIGDKLTFADFREIEPPKRGE